MNHGQFLECFLIIYPLKLVIYNVGHGNDCVTFWGFPERVGVRSVGSDSKVCVESRGHFCSPKVVCDTKVNELLLCRSGQIGFWARWVESVWRISLRQDAYSGGMSIPFVDPWEQSSISLLGTALMRPGILPFIRLSLQLGTAHSFRYGHSAVFVYTDTM